MNELTKLFLFMLVCVGLAWLYENTYVQTNHGPRRSKMIMFILTALLICYGGFRGQYNDTWTYRDTYTYLTYPFPEAWEFIPHEIGENPGFVIVNSFLKTYDVEVHLYLFFYFFWTILFSMSFLKRYSVNFPFAIFLFFAADCYLFNMAAMKQVMATSICLVAFPLALDKKLIKKMLYVALVLLASTFHVYALMYLIVFLLDFKPWKRGTYILLVVVVVGGFLFRPLLGTIIDVTTAIGENYTVEALSGEGISIVRLIVVWIPVVLSFIFREILFKDCPRYMYVIMHLTIVLAGIQFVGLFGTALYFGRLSYYFCIMPVISLTWMITKIAHYYPRDGRIIKTSAITGYTLFMYFSNTITTDYNVSYAAISLTQFLTYLFDWIRGLNT